MTLREFLIACQGVSEAVLDTEMKICFDTNGAYYNSPVDRLMVATENNYIGPSGVLCESELAADIDDLNGADESLDDYDLYIPKNTLILFAKTQF